ncbi:hypothetical protein [Fibrella aquatilis]|uniref:Uncharacterized protein n=1 Tax=Fibrella aquatilis TaxID=2817059 RepID=A0A939G7Z3_9BACT|nr:hypothetical protein [Fibrella aquatilis]MBO0932675.1 hypothetical protein [Fibrella aquatilis]
MILITELVDNYIERIEQATTLKEKQRITDDMLLYYYRLSESNKTTVRPKMQPFIDAIGRELYKTDPLVQKAHQLLGL